MKRELPRPAWRLSMLTGACLGTLAITSGAHAFQFTEATISDVHAALQSGEMSCTELVEGYLERIAAFDQEGPNFNAIQNINPLALEIAADIDGEIASGAELGPLHCIPVIVKDQVETDFMPTTFGSELFKDFVPTRNATIVERMMAADAIILAKSNLGEFAAGGSGSAFGDCHNAYDPAYFASGSSCGTGIALAASYGIVGIGEDTAGSTRGPASHSNIFGLRPTLPLVSRFGAMPQGPSRDTLGPMARTVRDTAILLDVLAGYDPKDPVTAASYGQLPDNYVDFLVEDGLEGMRVGVIREPMAPTTDTTTEAYAEAQGIVDQAVADIVAAGGIVLDSLEIPGLLDLLVASGGSPSTYELEVAINAYLAEHPNAPVGSYAEIVNSPLVIEARRTQMEGDLGQVPTDPAFQQLAKRQELQTVVLQAMAENELDLIMYASFDSPPVPLPQGTPNNNRLMSTFTGFPALSVPAGFSEAGLPIGIEFFGRPFDEGTLFRAAYGFEAATGHRTPPQLAPEL